MIKNPIIRIFELIVQGDRLSILDHNQLKQNLLENRDRLQIPDIDGLSADEIIDQRSRLLRSVYAEISQSLVIHNIQLDPPSLLLPVLWHYWLPLAQRIAHQQTQIGHCLIQGLLGGQGTGKTTLGFILNILLRHLGKTFLSISLDDLYKTYADRQKLRDRRPHLIWRGPPSTHDIDLGIQVLQQLRDRSSAVQIPRFDKSLHNGAGDRTEPEISPSADIILFEGWFVGMRPLPISAFDNFVPPILSEGDREFAIECNANLHDYSALWAYLDSLIVIMPEDYKHSLQWRLEAEHKLIATGKTGLSDREITRFVEYFWKALHPELFLPRMIGNVIGDRPLVDLVIEISRSHLPERIYQPQIQTEI